MKADLICVYLRSSAAPLGGKRLRHYIPQECLATAPFCPPPPLTRSPEVKRAGRFSFAIFHLSFFGEAFPFQQLLLSFQSPAIAAKALVFTYNAMTRDHERNGIRCTCTPDRANRARLAQRLRHIAIGDCFAVRDRTQLLPNLSL